MDPVDPTLPPAAVTYSAAGSVQKGPFTQGTSITIQPLDDSLNPTGKQYQTKTTDDAGTFSVGSEIESRYVEIIATGYYYNEIEGKVFFFDIDTSFSFRSDRDRKDKRKFADHIGIGSHPCFSKGGKEFVGSPNTGGKGDS